MTPAPVADRLVVLAVVGLLGAVAVFGVLGLVFLIWSGTPAEQLTPVVALIGPALGALGALLASTRTGAPMQAAAEAVGFQKAVDQVKAMDDTVQPEGAV